MDKLTRNLAIGLVVLMIFVPIGLIASGTAYGEWESNELKDKIGYVPQGFEELADLWHAPMKDYNIPNGPSFEDSEPVASAGYILSAVIGMIVGGGFLYFIGKKVAKD
jgi:cobalt/nickel transport system permease protein/cobalt/nickel transport protein